MEAVRGNLRKSLQDLISMIEPGQAGRTITALDIHELSFSDKRQWRDKGVVDAEYEQVLGGADDSLPHHSLLDLFAHAFINLHQNSDTKHLSCLMLAAREGKPSADLFLCVAHALHENRLPIVSMTVHLEVEQWAQDPSILGCDRLTTILAANDLSDSFRDLEQLSIHFARTEGCIQWVDEHSTAVERCYGMETDWYRSIFTLLELCPALRQLRLYGYKAWAAAQIGLLDQIVDRLPDLELGVVSLEGFGTADGELSRFLRHYSNTLYNVNVGAVMLTREEVKDLFSIVRTELPQIEEVCLDHLEIVVLKDPALLRS